MHASQVSGRAWRQLRLLQELARLLRECLGDYNLDPPNPTAAARIQASPAPSPGAQVACRPEWQGEVQPGTQALLWERHAIMAYLAVNSPQMCYRVLTSKMSDPPVPNCPAASPALWADILRSIQMTPQQKKNVMEARVIYLKKIGEALLERHELRKQMQVSHFPPVSGVPIFLNPLHSAYSQVARS